MGSENANTGERGPGATTPVGSYPQGASPYGALDMAGNVFEWTSSIYKPYPYRMDDGREDMNDMSSERVLRGGSWDSTQLERVRGLPLLQPHRQTRLHCWWSVSARWGWFILKQCCFYSSFLYLWQEYIPLPDELCERSFFNRYS